MKFNDDVPSFHLKNQFKLSNIYICRMDKLLTVKNRNYY